MRIVSLADILDVPTAHANAGKKKVMVSSGEVPHIHQYGRATFAPGEIATEHSHEHMYEIMLVESGNGEMKINSTVYPVAAGNCITVEPGETHEVVNTGSEPLVLTFFGVNV